ncbi:esterase-like activity of phytase family protein [Staphylococcus edaphicus]|uniref:Esterase-like activity of phytase family protein n=1 Tax=Staphylococcus edaphicus TaxID=1955013 RepID=A0A2C6VL81_9STAP|nr:esterase-like activity of phytase family protein [Staphylococcus edaphicus]PHK50921.1 hypothetical protein BTJ66_01085 [Staphylococcus edaphicus]UQW82609.1 esterase-like activity of phytase family protein [Staphylococcus edaphicus]
MKIIYQSFTSVLIALAALSPIHSHPIVAQTTKPTTQSDNHTVDNLKLIDSYTLPYTSKLDDTKVGGISGISYNPTTKNWLLISDDRSEHNASRFYEAKLNYNQNHFNNIQLKSTHFLKQPNGSNYINKKHFKDNPQLEVADPESIRLDPLYNQIMYTSEGDPGIGLNPFIRIASRNGNFISEIPITSTQKMDKHFNHGFRNNLSLEGSTFSTDGKTIWTAMEAPLIQDGKAPTPLKRGFSRITQYDRQGNLLSEYAYHLDAIPKAPGKGKEAENGVSELLAINNHEFLTLERASVQSSDGSYQNDVRIYKINTEGASDIKDQDTLKHNKFRPVKKELVSNLNKEHIAHIDNLEAISFGKKLPNGHDSIVVAADNNFNKSQISQFIAFEVIPE